VWALGCAVLLSCPSYKGGYFVKDSLKIRVATLDPAQWRQVDFSGNDLAWIHVGSPHVLAMNATCDEHGDPPLDVLTTHLTFGFTDKTMKSRSSKTLDGREALYSQYDAKLDGVEVELELVVLKKNGCVHDFMYVAPAGHLEEQRAAFDKLLAEFKVEARDG
jgi:hypothetical protein